MGYRHSWDVLTTYHCSNSGRLNVLNQYSTYSEKCPYNSECLTFTPIPSFSDLFHHTLPSFPFVSGPWKLNHFHVILPRGFQSFSQYLPFRGTISPQHRRHWS